MFSSQAERTTDREELKRKAIEFLQKHYIRYNPKDELPENFYMLEPNSNNGMKKIYMPKRGRELDDDIHVMYNNLSDGKIHQPVVTEYRIWKDIDPIWYRKISIFGNSARKAVLGGTKRNYKRKRQRKTRKS